MGLSDYLIPGRSAAQVEAKLRVFGPAYAEYTKRRLDRALRIQTTNRRPQPAISLAMKTVAGAGSTRAARCSALDAALFPPDHGANSTRHHNKKVLDAVVGHLGTDQKALETAHRVEINIKSSVPPDIPRSADMETRLAALDSILGLSGETSSDVSAASVDAEIPASVPGSRGRPNKAHRSLDSVTKTKEKSQQPSTSVFDGYDSNEEMSIYITQVDNETPKTIARKLGVAESELVKLNTRYTGLKARSKLRIGTSLIY